MRYKCVVKGWRIWNVVWTDRQESRVLLNIQWKYLKLG